MIKVSGRSITLRDFSLMRDGSPIYYAENFSVEDYGFGKVLVPKNPGTKYIDEDTATLTKYAGLAFYGMSGVDEVTENSVYLYWIDTLSNIWAATNKTGQKLHNSGNSNSYTDLKAIGEEVNDSIIYTTSLNIGRIFRGKATGGSATELDDTGVDFTTADWGLAAGDRVYNLKDNKLFTIDAGGVAATKLTVTAVDGGDFASGDNYAIVNPNWKALSNDKSNYGRQIIEFDQDFYILNGDALAIVDSSMAYTAEHKAIESGWIARCGASNGDTIAIGCNKGSLGKIFIWDKSSTGWIKKIKLDGLIRSIIAYGNSYIYITGNGIWITDGYSIRKMTEFPDVKETSYVNVLPNGMLIKENKLYVNVTTPPTGLLNRGVAGLYVFDLIKEDFIYFPFDPVGGVTAKKAGYGVTGGIIFDFSDKVYYSFYIATATAYGWANSQIVSEFKPNDNQNSGAFITNPISLGKNARIKKIEVSLMNNLFEHNNVASPSFTVDCKLSNCERPLWQYVEVKVDSTELDEITIDGTIAAYADAQVGDEVFIRDGWNGHSRRVILSIAGAGTATEVWTLDSNLPNLTIQGTTVSIMPLQRYGMTAKTITTLETKMLEFYPDFYGDNVMLELIVTGTSTYPTPAIKSIKLYYE